MEGKSRAEYLLVTRKSSVGGLIEWSGVGMLLALETEKAHLDSFILGG